MKDFYTVTIQVKQETVKKIVIKAVSHSIIDPQLFSIIGVDRKRYLFPLSNISYIEFDNQLDIILMKGNEGAK